MRLRNGNGHSEKLEVYCKTLRGVELKITNEYQETVRRGLELLMSNQSVKKLNTFRYFRLWSFLIF